MERGNERTMIHVFQIEFLTEPPYLLDSLGEGGYRFRVTYIYFYDSEIFGNVPHGISKRSL